MGPSTVGVVIDNFPDSKARAYTTILSVLQNLEKKKLVKSKRSGRANIYSATKSLEAIMKPYMRDLVREAFSGSVGDAALTLLSAGSLTADEKKELEAALKSHKAIAKRKVAKKAPAPVAKKAAKKSSKKAAKKVSKKKVAKKAGKKKAAKKAAKKVSKKAGKKKVARKRK